MVYKYKAIILNIAIYINQHQLSNLQMFLSCESRTPTASCLAGFKPLAVQALGRGSHGNSNQFGLQPMFGVMYVLCAYIKYIYLQTPYI
jgi:hypothetical protein